MTDFITTNEKTYHKFRDCKWLEKISESKIIYQEYTDITEQQPCRGCTKREDLVTNGFDPDEAKRLVTE